jgi:molybdate/tungstate transport system substrate-binding protein
MLAASGNIFAKEKIIIFHAGSLSVPFMEIEKEFEHQYPQYDVIREAAGSRECARKITDIGKKSDVMASADYEVINNLLIPGYAKFNAQFAVNEMVLAYTKHSRFSDTINSKNWPEILLRKNVKTGHSNPNLDPCGYRAVLAVKLAEKYYNIPNFYDNLMGYGESYENGEEKRTHITVRPKETDLLALLEIGAIDYFFIYRSVAQQHNLRFLELPPEVSLKEANLNKLYHNVSFKISGKKPGQFITKYGTPMVYGITIVEHDKSMPVNRNGAISFVKFVLSENGQKIMAENGQPPIIPPKISGNQSILK